MSQWRRYIRTDLTHCPNSFTDVCALVLSQTMMSDPKRSRNKDFSSIECEILMEKFVENNEILSSKHSNEITERRKQSIIQDILMSVNSRGGNGRTLNAIKEKWQNERRRAKKKVSDFLNAQKKSISKTGGGMGEVDPNANVSSILNEMELKIYSTIPPETTVGIEGGVSSKFEGYVPSSNHPIVEITNQANPTISIPRENDEGDSLRSNSVRIRNSSSSKRKLEVTKHSTITTR